MAIRVKEFTLSKQLAVEPIKKFYEAQRLSMDQILHVGIVQKTPNVAVYLITYEDVVAPYVLGTVPANGNTNVPINTEIVIQMSEDVEDVVPADVEVLRNGTPVSLVSGDIVTAGSVITISNAIDSSYNANYVVTLKTTVEDASGNTMEQPHVFSFTSQSQAAGIGYKGDTVQPNAGDISAGYKDIVFASAFPSADYVVAEPGFEYTGPVSGVRFRITNKQASGFRCNFDFIFPSGAQLNWVAMHGAPS